MAKRKFDLSSMMETVSKLDTIPGPEVRMIPLDDILNNKANFYKVDKAELEPLADSIAMDGLQQFPVVMPHPEQEGKYILLSGHRRCAAIRMLVETRTAPREDLRLVPCTVRQYRSEAMAELQLILANSTARTLTSAEISKQAERIEMLLYQLKEEGHEFPGRMRDKVAAACNVSAPKLARLKVIREKLKAPEFIYLFEKDKLPEQTAYALARLPEDFQKRLAGINPNLTGNTAELILRKYEEGWRWEPDMACPDGKVCRRGDSFLRHDLECICSDMCGGEKCCLDCSGAKTSYYPCNKMCSKAKSMRKETLAENKSAVKQAAQIQTRKYQEATQLNAKRVLRAIEAAGLSDETRLPWGSSFLLVEKIRRFAAGEFSQEDCRYCAELDPERLYNPAQTVRLLGCSADYLLGLTDELTPPAPVAVQEDTVPADVVEALLEEHFPSPQEICPVWLPGVPEKSGPVVARFSLSGYVMVTLCWYDAALDTYRSSAEGISIEEECTGWWPVPERMAELERRIGGNDGTTEV